MKIQMKYGHYISDINKIYNRNKQNRIKMKK
jgi:hypothetical protein